MNSALEREITPNKAGMRRLDEQIGDCGPTDRRTADQLLGHVNMPKLSRWLRGLGQGSGRADRQQLGGYQVRYRGDSRRRSSPSTARHRTVTPLSVWNAEGLRAMRQSADRDVNHNRVNSRTTR